jgi:butyryl-CoA dehydrogenase
LATCVAVEELAYFSNAVAAIYDVHCILAGQALARGDQAIRDTYLPQIIAGDVVASFATSEPEASTDLSPTSLATRLVDDDGALHVTGHKRWITNSPVAAFVVVLCADGSRTSLAVVDLRSEGVAVGRPDRKMGNRVQLTADITFDRVRVDASQIVGHRGEGLKIALQTLTYGRIGIAAAGVGMGQRAFDETASHVRRRHVFGRPIGALQHWQFLLADRATELENARSLYIKAALRRDAGIDFPEPEAAMAKHYGTRLAVDMARDAIQAHGAYGFVSQLAADGAQYCLESIYRDSKIGEIYEGANEIQKWVIARQILGRDITG